MILNSFFGHGCGLYFHHSLGLGQSFGHDLGHTYFQGQGLMFMIIITTMIMMMWVGSKHLLIDLLITQSNLSTTHCTTKSFPTSKGVEIVKQIEINPHPSSLNALDQEGVHGAPSAK